MILSTVEFSQTWRRHGLGGNRRMVMACHKRRAGFRQGNGCRALGQRNFEGHILEEEKYSKLWLLFSSVCWPCWYWLFVRPQQTDIKNCWNHWRRCRAASRPACLQLWVLPEHSNGRRPYWPCVLLHQRLGVFSSIFFSSLGHSHFSWKSRIK